MNDYLKKNKVKVLFFLAAFFVPLIVYILTLAPTVTFGDSGELITAAYFLGISHPPGSPLWTILAKLFTFLPINSIAWRVNFSSAFFSALAAALFFTIQLQIVKAMHLKTNKLLIYCCLLISTFFLSFSRTVWTISTIAEIWSLNNLIFCLLILTLYKWIRTNKHIFLYLASLLFGLNLGTHYFSLILIPALIFWVTYSNRSLLKEYKSILFLVLFFLIGLSVYLYLPIRAKADPPINWGNPSNLPNFLNYIERKQFGVSLENSPEVKLGGIYLPISRFKSLQDVLIRTVSSLHAFALSLYEEFPWWFLLMSSVGLAIFLLHMKDKKEAKSWFLFLLFCFASTGWGFAFLTNAAKPLSNTYFTQYIFSFFVLCIFFGIALVWSAEKVFLKLGSKSIFAPILIGTLFLFLQMKRNYLVSNWSNNRIAYFHGINILDNVDKNAIIIADKNNWIFPLLYLTKVENKRPDVTIYDRTGNLFELVYQHPTITFHTTTDWEKSRQIVEEKIAQKYPQRPFYYAADKNFENYDHDVNMEGILYKSKKFTSQNIDFTHTYQNILSIPKITWIESDSDYTLSYYHLRFGDELIKEKKENEALIEYEKASKLAQDHVVALNNVATSYVRLGKVDQGIAIFKKVLSIDTNNRIALANLAEVNKIKGNNNPSLQSKPTNQQLAIENNIRTHYRAGECEKADELYNSLNEAGSNPQILNNIGICYAQKNNLSEAKKRWEQSLKIDPSYQPAKDNLKKLEKFNR